MAKVAVAKAGLLRKSKRKRAPRSFLVAGTANEKTKNYIDPVSSEDERIDATDDDEYDADPPEITENTKKVRKVAKSKKQRRKMGDLFAALSDKNTAIAQLARDLLDSPVEEISSKLCLLLMECCGVSEGMALKHISRNDLEARDFTMDETKIQSLAVDSASDADCFVETYTVGERTNNQFLKGAQKFWSLLLEENDGALLFVDDGSVLYFLVEGLERLSTARHFAFRHTSVFYAKIIGCCLIRTLHSQFSKLEKALKQLSAIIGKSGSEQLGAAFVAFHKAIQLFCLPGTRSFDNELLEKTNSQWFVAFSSMRATEQKESIKQITGICNKIAEAVLRSGELIGALWDSILTKRYQDVNCKVRAECLRCFGEWMSLDSARFTPKGKVYIERLVLDKSHVVREESCRAFSKCMSAPNPYTSLSENDASRLQKATASEKAKWARRLKNSITDVLLLDREPSVAVVAVEALSKIHSLDSALISRLDYRSIELCLCVRGDDFRPLRIAAAKFLDKWYFKQNGAIENEGIDSGNDEITGINCETKVEEGISFTAFLNLMHRLLQNRTGLGHEAGDIDIFDDENMDENAFSELNVTLDPAQAYDLVDAFWSLPRAKRFLSDWVAAFKILNGYGESDIAGQVGEFKAKLVSSVIRAAASRASEVVASTSPIFSMQKMSKKEMKILETEREHDLQTLHSALLRYLPDSLSIFKHNPTVLSNLIALIYNVEKTKCAKDTERRAVKSMVSSLAKVVSVQSDPSLLLCAAKCLSEHFCLGEEHPLRQEAYDEYLKLESTCFENAQNCLTEYIKIADSSNRNDESSFQEGIIKDVSDEADIALRNSFRRINALLRISDDAESSQLTDSLRVGISQVVNSIVRRWEQLDNAKSFTLLSLLNDALLILEVDFFHAFHLATQALAIAAEKAREQIEKDTDLNEIVSEALVRRDRLISVLSVVAVCPDDRFVRVVLPAYHELRVFCAPALAKTQLHKLAWSVPEDMDKIMASHTVDIVVNNSQNGHLVTDVGEDVPVSICYGRSAVQRAVLNPAYCSMRFSGSDKTNVLQEFFMKALVNDSLLGPGDLGGHIRNLAEKFGALKSETPKRWCSIVLSILRNLFQSSLGTDNDAGIDSAKLNFSRGLAQNATQNKRKCPEKLGRFIAEMVSFGVKFAFEQSQNVVFLSLLLPFVVILRKKDIQAVRETWISVTESLREDVAEAIFSNGGEQTNPVRQVFYDFEKALGVSTEPVDSSELASEKNDSDKYKRKQDNSDIMANKRSRSEPSSPNDSASEEIQDSDAETDTSRKEIEKNLFESDTESVKKALSSRRSLALLNRQQKVSSPGGSEVSEPLFDDESDSSSSSESDVGTGIRPRRLSSQ